MPCRSLIYTILGAPFCAHSSTALNSRYPTTLRFCFASSMEPNGVGTCKAKLNTFDPPHRVKFDRPVDVHWVPADQVPTGPDWDDNQRQSDSLRQAAQFVIHGLSIADRANVDHDRGRQSHHRADRKIRLETHVGSARRFLEAVLTPPTR